MCAEAKTAHEETEGKCATTSLLPQQPYCFRWGPSVALSDHSFPVGQTAGAGVSHVSGDSQGSAALRAFDSSGEPRRLRCLGSDGT